MNFDTLRVPVLIVIVLASAACRPSTDPANADGELGDELQTLVDEAVRDHPEVPAAALAVVSSRLGVRWAGAAGVADPGTGEPMTAEHPVWIASNTKTFVAAATLRLWERRSLGLDDPIDAHLPAELAELLRGDGYDPDAITIRHLLTHTSGIFDHSESPNYAARIGADPRHRWTRKEQVAAAMAWGDPYGEPGEVYRYSDTGYVLLGRIVEQVSGTPLAEAVRELVGFERLGLRSTWWDVFEPRPPGVLAPAHQFDGDFDTYEIDPSIDLYGGGGLIATMGDLARFTRGLFTGAVYADPGTLDMMLAAVDGAGPGPGEPSLVTIPGVYRMGIFVVDVDGLTVYRHSGYWGTVASYAPELDVAVAATVNQNDARAVLMDLERRALATVRTVGR